MIEKLTAEKVADVAKSISKEEEETFKNALSSWLGLAEYTGRINDPHLAFRLLCYTIVSRPSAITMVERTRQRYSALQSRWLSRDIEDARREFEDEGNSG